MDVNINDIVYFVKDYNIVKAKVKQIIESTDAKGTTVTYTIASVTTNKEFQCLGAMLVPTLEIALDSAMQNWESIYSRIKEGFKTITEESFNPIEKLNDIPRSRAKPDQITLGD